MIYTVDLLEGRKIPPPSKPVSVALVTVALLIPALASSLLASQYLANQTQLGVLQRQVSNLEQNLLDLAEIETWMTDFAAQKEALLERREPLSEALSARVPLSNILADIAAKLPDSVALDCLAVVRREVRDKPSEKPILYYTLELGVLTCQDSQGIEQLVQYLRFDPSLKLKAQNISIVSQEHRTVEGQGFPLYSLHCALEL